MVGWLPAMSTKTTLQQRDATGNWPTSDHKIDLRLAPALETLDRLIEDGEENSYDFAFIDADKETEYEYYERCFKLIRPGGLIAIDNVLWNGKVVDSAV